MHMPESDFFCILSTAIMPVCHVKVYLRPGLGWVAGSVQPLLSGSAQVL